jgi:hypothetical protein
LTELPLKTDLVIWLPLTETQRLIYQYLIENQDMQRIVESREIKNAFFILSYIKKLCMHPQLLAVSSAEKKRNLGLLSPEEEAILQAQIDEEEKAMNNKDWKMRTRRSNKNENVKTKMMCKALEHAEKRASQPEIEGELKDMPVTEVDYDWKIDQKGARNQSKNKKNQ